MSLLTVELGFDIAPLDFGFELLDCDGCGEESPADEGDIRTAFGEEFSLCENCVQDWDEHGIPNHIAARYLG